MAQGATVAVGGTFEEDDLTVHPTMLTGVTPQMKILQEEIFAPLLPVMTYDTIDQVIGYIEARDKPLALYVFSHNEANVQKVLDRTSSGGVTVNGVFSHYLENRPAVRRRQRQRHGQLSRLFRLQGVLARARRLHAPGSRLGAAATAAARNGRRLILSPFEWTIAKRYLLPGKGEGFIALVASISLVAVMLGVAALIIVMSVMNGFRAELFDKIVGLNGHAVIQGYGGRLDNWQQIARGSARRRRA